MPKVARLAWAVLAYNVAVILWGAYVRATGSGAGCGAHWPLCNGEVVPRAAGVATLIEFSHRATSGLALLAVAALVVATFRTCRAGHPARAGAVMSGALILSEAAVGAGLVLFQLVADNATMARAMFVAAHLLNTFLLLAALTLTAWWLSVGVPFTAGRRGRAYLMTGCAALLVAGASGAVAALGDTLFPAQSLAASLRDDLSFTSHLLIRLRVFHPVLAVVAAGVVGDLCRPPRTIRADAEPARRSHRHGHRPGPDRPRLLQRRHARAGVAAARAPAGRRCAVDRLRAARRLHPDRSGRRHCARPRGVIAPVPGTRD